VDALTWIEFILTLEKRFGVSRGLTTTSVASERVPFLKRTLPSGREVSVTLPGFDGNRGVPQHRVRQILSRLEIPEDDFDAS
jgi:hypothetical protein